MSRVSPLFGLVASSLLYQALAATPLTKPRLTARDSIPDFAIKYAPYTYLYSGEAWWPSDISTHIQHVKPEVNFSAIASSVTLENLNTFPSDAYLTSNDNVETAPAWLVSTYGKPDGTGYSAAPATIIVADKTDYVDVFYFYFYSYNQGLTIFDIEFGNHVGDWEHSMVRFSPSGEPIGVYLSEHSSGSAYNYSTVSKTSTGRPITYVANGGHANYATAGDQDYEGGFLAIFGIFDKTSQGLVWDVTLNYRGFTFDTATSTFTSASGVDIGGSEQGPEGTSWLNWLGIWGDQQYPDSDSRQNCDFEDITNECTYVSGPTGPLAKNLGRTALCENESDCTIKDSL
ncbi:hypothetical protein F5884DRAFT_4217 [Xylogone sp. PMI_703]|nr:hypothetical protein F5884DRAFT_4217 [Xylogone sp. PMI_703]